MDLAGQLVAIWKIVSFQQSLRNIYEMNIVRIVSFYLAILIELSLIPIDSCLRSDILKVV